MKLSLVTLVFVLAISSGQNAYSTDPYDLKEEIILLRTMDCEATISEYTGKDLETKVSNTERKLKFTIKDNKSLLQLGSGPLETFHSTVTLKSPLKPSQTLYGFSRLKKHKRSFCSIYQALLSQKTLVKEHFSDKCSYVSQGFGHRFSIYR